MEWPIHGPFEKAGGRTARKIKVKITTFLYCGHLQRTVYLMLFDAALFVLVLSAENGAFCDFL